MRLTVVGAAGSFPGPHGPASSYLVETEDGSGRPWRVLLDLGNGALGPLQRFVEPHDIDAVLLSHLHPDHCLDLCGLYVALSYHPTRVVESRLPVYGPVGTLERLDRAYGTDGEGHLGTVFDVRHWSDGHPVTVGPFSVVPYRVEHPVESYGQRVVEGAGTAGAAVLAYTGDTDSCPALRELARDADLFLAEASFQEGRETIRGVHLTGLRAGRAAAEAGVDRLILTHVPSWTDPEVVLAEARSVFPGPVRLARAGDVHEI
ncbi:MAG: MBL fold metallo-hydrolase [Kineosporiaceae bacterium]